MDSATLTHMFNFNQRALKINLDGITHEDSVRLPSPAGNSINWIVGHLVANRQAVLELAGEPTIWSDADSAPYDRGSKPLAPEDARPMAALVADFDRTQEAIARGLARLGPTELAAPKGNSTVAAQLIFLHFHEAYHIGQTGIVRRLIGKPGAIR
jgi:hypothetical protein